MVNFLVGNLGRRWSNCAALAEGRGGQYLYVSTAHHPKIRAAQAPSLARAKPMPPRSLQPSATHLTMKRKIFGLMHAPAPARIKPGTGSWLDQLALEFTYSGI